MDIGGEDPFLSFDPQSVYDLQKCYFILEHVEQKERTYSDIGKTEKKTRSKPRGHIYRALAEQAEFAIQDLIKNNILPATRKRKLAEIRINKSFETLAATLSVKDEYLIRKLGEARPGLWEIGKKPGREHNKKYRKKSNYKS